MPSKLIDCYRAIEDHSHRMLEAAHLGDWRRVAMIEDDCSVLIGQLKMRAAQAGQAGFPVAERAEKQRILTRILGMDAQIRDLAEPWTASLPRPKVLH